MATPNIVPRADSEGGLGTASKYWASAYIDAITTTGNVTVGGTLQVEASSSPNFQLYRSGTGQLWHFSIDSSGRFMLKEAASLGGTKNLRLQIDDDGDATFAANIALGGGAFNTTHANVTSIVNLDDNASIFTRSDLTNIGQNIYYNSSDAGAAIEDGRSTLVSLGKGTFSVHNSSASVSADAATSLQERFSIDTAGAATFAGNVTIANNDATLTLYAAASPFTPKIEFIRNSATFGDDTSTDFRLIDTGGIFKIQSGHKPSGGSIETKDLLILSENSSNPTATLVGIPFYSDTANNSMYTHDPSGNTNYSLAQNNTSYGFSALAATTTGDNNTAVGKGAGGSLNSGNNNTILGAFAGDSLTTADYNVAIGMNALGAEDTFGYSVAVGAFSLLSQNGADNAFNVGVGYGTGQNITTGVRNVIIGGSAGDGLSLGSHNIAVGYSALSAVNAGSKSVAIGSGALQVQVPQFTRDSASTTAGDATVTFPAESRVVTGQAVEVTAGTDQIPANTFVGAVSAGSPNSTFEMVDAAGSEVVATGSGTVSSLTLKFTGGVDSHNTAVGYNAGYAVTTGLRNTLIGSHAGDSVTSGIYNTAVGYAALATENISGFNTAIGYGALRSQNTTAEFGYNVAVGKDAGTNVSTGINNTIIGGLAGDALQTGSNNILIGKDAAASASDADNETVIGHTATTSALIHGAMTNRAYTGTASGGGFNITGAVSISVGEYNSEIVTSIFVDIGVGSILSSSTAGDVIGEDGVAAAFITKLTTAINGVVYRGEMICLEVPTTGDPDVNLCANASGTIAEDAAGEGEHVLINGGVATLAVKNDIAVPSGGIQDDFIYLTHGGTTAGTYDAGKFLIRFYGAKVTGL